MIHQFKILLYIFNWVNTIQWVLSKIIISIHIYFSPINYIFSNYFANETADKCKTSNRQVLPTSRNAYIFASNFEIVGTNDLETFEGMHDGVI